MTRPALTKFGHCKQYSIDSIEYCPIQELMTTPSHRLQPIHNCNLVSSQRRSSPAALVNSRKWQKCLRLAQDKIAKLLIFHFTSTLWHLLRKYLRGKKSTCSYTIIMRISDNSLRRLHNSQQVKNVTTREGSWPVGYLAEVSPFISSLVILSDVCIF